MADELLPVGAAGNSKKLLDMTGYVAEVVALGAGTAAIGKTLSAIGGLGASGAVYNVTCTVADTQYSQALPTNCRGFDLQCRTFADVRLAFVTGKVAGPTAPYITVKAGQSYSSPVMEQGASPQTIYVASSTAGVVVEIIPWV